MQMTLTTAPAEVDLDALGAFYPEREGRGQVLVVQNLGPGDVFFDFSDDPTEAGLKIAVESAYEFPPAALDSMRGLHLSATELTDVRIVVMG